MVPTAVKPVPPLAGATDPVSLEALRLAIFASVTLPSNILEVRIALLAIEGKSAVPDRSPANLILPLLLPEASAVAWAST